MGHTMVPNNITLLISHENWDISSQVTKTHHSIPVITLININSVTFSDEFKSMVVTIVTESVKLLPDER